MIFFKHSNVVLATGCALALLASAWPAPGNVFASSRKDQGAALFADKGCSHCHGPAGFGGTDSGPDLSNVRKELRPVEIAQQIHDGGNNMPPFGEALTNDELTSLVAYLHAKRKPPPGWVKKQPSAAAPKPASNSDPD